MEKYAVDKDIKSKLLAILNSSGSILQTGKATIQSDQDQEDFEGDIFIDLDRLWSDCGCFGKLIDALLPLFKELDQTIHFDVMLSIVSRVGAFGPTPWASVIAQNLNKSLVVIEEQEFGGFRTYPLTKKGSDLFRSCRVIILKDIIVYGTSVVQAIDLVDLHEGNPACLFTLVDLTPPNGGLDIDELDIHYCSVLDYQGDVEAE